MIYYLCLYANQTKVMLFIHNVVLNVCQISEPRKKYLIVENLHILIEP